MAGEIPVLAVNVSHPPDPILVVGELGEKGRPRPLAPREIEIGGELEPIWQRDQDIADKTNFVY